MSKLVAVTGATGYVGRFVIPQIIKQGWQVRALVRAQSDRAGFPAGIEWTHGSLTDPQAVQQLVDGADAVVHLAYAHVPGRYRGGEGDDLPGWLGINLHGSLDLLLKARTAQVRQFIFLSSRAVFSRTEPGRVLAESHPVSPITHYGAYKVAVESMMASFAAVEEMSCTSVRSTGVYGVVWPMERSKWWGLLNRVLSGEAIQSSRVGTEVHGEDVARTVIALLREPERAPSIVHLSDLAVSHRQIIALAAEVSGRTLPLPPPPEQPIKNPLATTELPKLGVTLGGEPLLRQTIQMLVHAIIHHDKKNYKQKTGGDQR